MEGTLTLQMGKPVAEGCFDLSEHGNW